MNALLEETKELIKDTTGMLKEVGPGTFEP
jgi:hypothetical protein